MRSDGEGIETVGDDERQARMLLSRITEPGDVDACTLVHDHNARDLVSRLRSGPFSGESKVATWAGRLRSVDCEPDAVDAALADARYICPGDPEWPTQVDDLTYHCGGGDRRGGRPFGLWVRGSRRLSDLTRSAVAVVGARASTAYGDHVAGDLSYGCAEQGITVVSGGAYGVDASAHRGALAQGGLTVAVLAGGIDRLYPTGNAPLLRTIARDGLLISEAGPGCAPTKSRFLVRNRLIAALSQGTVVVEAALRSGSLNTARWAGDLNRLVMGVPGPITSQTSAGVHQLLRNPTDCSSPMPPRSSSICRRLGQGSRRANRAATARADRSAGEVGLGGVGTAQRFAVSQFGSLLNSDRGRELPFKEGSRGGRRSKCVHLFAEAGEDPVSWPRAAPPIGLP